MSTTTEKSDLNEKIKHCNVIIVGEDILGVYGLFDDSSMHHLFPKTF